MSCHPPGAGRPGPHPIQFRTNSAEGYGCRQAPARKSVGQGQRGEGNPAAEEAAPGFKIAYSRLHNFLGVHWTKIGTQVRERLSFQHRQCAARLPIRASAFIPSQADGQYRRQRIHPCARRIRRWRHDHHDHQSGWVNHHHRHRAGWRRPLHLDHAGAGVHGNPPRRPDGLTAASVVFKPDRLPARVSTSVCARRLDGG